MDSRLVLQLLLLLLLAASAQGYLVRPERLQLVLIGSTSPGKAAYLRAANASVARHFKVHAFSEADVPPCRTCARTASEYHSGRFVLPFYNDEPFLHKSDGESHRGSQPAGSRRRPVACIAR
jgi:hypothetical protein